MAASTESAVVEVLVLAGRPSGQTLRLAAVQRTVDAQTGVLGADDVRRGGGRADGQKAEGHHENQGGMHSQFSLWDLVFGVCC